MENNKQSQATGKNCFVAILFVSLVWGGKSSAQNIVVNGNFGDNPTFLTGWTQTAGAVLGNAVHVQQLDGTGGLGLASGGSVFQTLNTSPGQAYQLSFYMASWGPDSVPPGIVSLTPAWNGLSLSTANFDGTGKTFQDMGWTEFSYNVVAPGSSTQLSFTYAGKRAAD